jgi:argininosuccinate lyase
MMLWAQLPMQKCWPNGLLTTAETESLVAALEEIIVDVEKNVIEDSFEDVHSKIEYYRQTRCR